MAAKSKKRLSKIGNNVLKFEKLELKDVLCSICQSILVKPVTLPCFHGFCQSCFNGSVENNALCCPLCRLRIGSWLRTATKQNSLVNEELWKCIQSKFSNEIDSKIKGEDVDLPPEKPILRLSAPGEIRREYEAELIRLREERLQLEEKHLEETELLIKKIQDEEEQAHKKYIEALKKDEVIAQQMQKELAKCSAPPTKPHRGLMVHSLKSRLKDTKIDSYLSKNNHAIPTSTKTVEDSPLITDDNTSRDCTPAPVTKLINGASPEMVPSYGKIIKSLIEKKNKIIPGLWNKENGDRLKDKKEITKISSKKTIDTEDKSKIKHKNGIPSLLVSLPLPCGGILQQKTFLENRRGADSVDSMRQELCYFKPIDQVLETSANKDLPLRVPGVRPSRIPASPVYEPGPTRTQYLESLCNLRHLSLAKKLPSAFVIALNILQVHRKGTYNIQSGVLSFTSPFTGDNESSAKCETRSSSKMKKRKSTSPSVMPSLPTRRNPNRNKQIVKIDGITKINNGTYLRRTRSMGSISADDNETTPKKSKTKPRKSASEKKPHLRSDTKKSSVKKEIESPPLYNEALNNNKVNLAVKNLSSPFKNCDMKHILDEQLRIEKIIEQEKIDFELARKIEEEWNSRRPRRAAVKRQVTLSYAMKPAKKLKV